MCLQHQNLSQKSGFHIVKGPLICREEETHYEIIEA